jgi:hypothetical protein
MVDGPVGWHHGCTKSVEEVLLTKLPMNGDLPASSPHANIPASPLPRCIFSILFCISLGLAKGLPVITRQTGFKQHTCIGISSSSSACSSRSNSGSKKRIAAHASPLTGRRRAALTCAAVARAGFLRMPNVANECGNVGGCKLGMRPSMQVQPQGALFIEFPRRTFSPWASAALLWASLTMCTALWWAMVRPAQ